MKGGKTKETITSCVFALASYVHIKRGLNIHGLAAFKLFSKPSFEQERSGNK